MRGMVRQLFAAGDSLHSKVLSVHCFRAPEERCWLSMFDKVKVKEEFHI